VLRGIQAKYKYQAWRNSYWPEVDEAWQVSRTRGQIILGNFTLIAQIVLVLPGDRVRLFPQTSQVVHYVE
jgi:hypothetical protein